MVRPLDRAAWLALLEAQDGLVTHRQCREHGITSDAIRRHLADRSWQRAFRKTYLAQPGPVSHRALTRAALLEIGGLVVATHETTIWLADERRRPPAVVHAAVLEGRSVAPAPGLRLHWLPDLGEERVLWRADPPRTRVTQATLDLVNAATSDDERIRIIGDVVSRRLVTVDELRAALADRPRIRARAVVEELLGEVKTGAVSPLEARDLRNDGRHGIVGGQRQVRIRRGGRRDWLDVVFSGNGLRRDVVKELDGRLGHDDLDGRFRDMRRDNAAEERNQSHLRYGWRDLVSQPCEVARQTSSVLVLHGWRGRLRRCGTGCSAAPLQSG